MATSRASSARAAVDLTFEELYRGHRADVYRAALRELGNAHDAEDVTQAAFVDAYRAVLRGTRPQSPRAWLLAISENVRRRRFRTAQRRPREDLVEDADFPLTADLPHEQSRALSEALAALPPEQRRVFVLREVVGLTYVEIAAEVDSTVASVQMLLFRARRSLRDQLDPPTVSRRPIFLPPLPGWLVRVVVADRGRDADAACRRRARRRRADDRRRECRRAGAAGSRAGRGHGEGRSRRRAYGRSCRGEAESRCAEDVAHPSPCRRGDSDARRRSGRVRPQRLRRAAPDPAPAPSKPTVVATAATPYSAPRAGTPQAVPTTRADAGGGNGRGQGARGAGGAAAAAASGSAACGCAASGRSASAPGPTAARTGRGRGRDRRGGRRWGERSAVAGSCGPSSDAAAGALGRGPGACGSLERAHPLREEASRAAILSRGVTVSRC